MERITEMSQAAPEMTVAVTEPATIDSEEGLQTPPSIPVEDGASADSMSPGEVLTEAPAEAETIDYDRLAEEDLAKIKKLVPALSGITHIGELPGANRYAELRDLGLGVEEAFWAACRGVVGTGRTVHYDNRSHLHSAVPRGVAGNPAVMSAAEMSAARDLFDDLSDAEIQKLYARCR